MAGGNLKEAGGGKRDAVWPWPLTPPFMDLQLMIYGWCLKESRHHLRHLYMCPQAFSFFISLTHIFSHVKHEGQKCDQYFQNHNLMLNALYLTQFVQMYNVQILEKKKTGHHAIPKPSIPFDTLWRYI